MTRVLRRAASAHTTRAPSKAAKTKTRKHKVIMESITQEKKKLRSVISFETKAPRGYTFIPAGNPQLTNACKEMCRKDGLKVFAVTTTPHQHVHDLSQQVHRIGYHFPSSVVATVCMELGLYLTSTGKVMPFQSAGNNGFNRRADSEVSQTTINTEARDVIRDLFPNIPEKDLNQIISTAFQKGQRKVGTAVELPLARRAQLAVVAHIRHVYTNYDRLLKVTSFQEARSLVEEPTLAKLVEWRGDDENGKTVLEDVFREVIVISDDEDSDTEQDSDHASVDRDSSVEIVSSNALAGEVQTEQVNYASISREPFRDPSDDEAPPGFRFVPEVTKETKAGKEKIDRRGFSRYQAWERARDRYRVKKTFATDQANFHGNSIESQALPYSLQRPPRESAKTVHETLEPIHSSQVAVARHVPVAAIDTISQGHLRHSDSLNNRPDTHSRNTEIDHRVSAEYMIDSLTNFLPSPANVAPAEAFKLTSVEPHELQSSHRPPTDVMQLKNGSIIERVPVSVGEKIATQSLEPENAPVFVRGPEAFLDRRRQFERPSRAPVAYRERMVNPQNHVLPSIEDPQTPPPTLRRPEVAGSGPLTGGRSGAFPARHVTPLRRPVDDLSRRVDVIDITDDRGDTLKKRRIEYHEHTRDIFHPEYLPRDAGSFAPTFDKGPYEEERCIPLISPGSGYKTIQDDARFHSEQIPSVDRRRMIGRHPDRITVNRASPFLTMHSKSDTARPSDRACMFPQGPPVSSDRHQYDVDSSHNSSLRPTFSGTGYVRRDGSSAKPDQFSHFVSPQSHHIYNGNRAFSSLEGTRPFQEAGQSMSVWRGDYNRRVYVSNDDFQSRSTYSHDFVHPVDLHDPGMLSHHVMQRPHLQDEQDEQISSRRTRYIPMPSDPDKDRWSSRMAPRSDPRLSPTPRHQPLSSRVPPPALDGNPHASQYAPYQDSSRTLHASSTTGCYETRRDGPLDSARIQHPLRIVEQTLPVYPRRVEQQYRHISDRESALVLAD